MHFAHRCTVTFCLLVLVGCAENQIVRPTTAPSTYRKADEVRSTLTYLASDELEGRGLQTAGVQKAADYIATRFESAGLVTTPGMDGYFQSFPINLADTVGKATQLSINEQLLKPGTDFTPLGMSAETKFSGSLAFVGYSITYPEKNYDDYAGIDVKGKIALALRGELSDEKGNSKFAKEGRSDHATFTAKAKAAADHGATALIVINSAKDDKLMPLSQSGGDKSPIPVLQLSRSAAASVLQHAGERFDLDNIQSKIDSSVKPRSLVIDNVKASGAVEIQHDRKQFRNVIACLPGKGPHKDEFIVVGAHYDHLGRGERGSIPQNAGKIHNGADDNGSGSTALIELATEIAHRGPMDRSILFIAFCGEERGLLGSKYFVNNPVVPLDRIVAMLNLDMVGRVKDDVVYVSGNGTANEFDALLKQANRTSPLIIKPAGADVGGKGGIGPSDHESFALKHIPVLMIWTGMHRDYHRPTDKVDKINFLGIAEVVDFSQTLLEELAKMPRAQYVSKFDKAPVRGGSMKVRLGIMPDYNADPTLVGVRVGGTMPDAPAEKAGLKEGDVIVSIDADKIASLGDYMTILGKHKPGDTIKITVQRDGKPKELSATLSEPKG